MSRDLKHCLAKAQQTLGLSAIAKVFCLTTTFKTLLASSLKAVKKFKSVVNCKKICCQAAVKFSTVTKL